MAKIEIITHTTPHSTNLHHNTINILFSVLMVKKSITFVESNIDYYELKILIS